MTEEQIKKFWEWCGLVCLEDDTTFTRWEDADGNLICCGHINKVPDIGLNNLFKWAVPRLQSTNRGFVLCDTQGRPPYHAEIYTYNTCFGEAHAATVTDKDPALALFWAIYKVLEAK